MPELPEVETMRRGIQAIVGQKIRSVRRTRCRKKPISIQPPIDEFNRRVRGRAILATERLGKRIILRLDDSQRILIEPRMTGLVLIDPPPNLEHLRFEVRLSSRTHPQLWFWDRRGLGSVRLVTAHEYDQLVHERGLGKDALQISVDELRTRLGRRPTPIKVALMDQKHLAGIGNLYASEILHRARIHPALPCRCLTATQWSAIAHAVRLVLRAAIRAEGSTLSDGTYRNALNQPGEFQNRHRVYDRAGKLCRTCRKGTIQRVVQAQRATFFCPHCQARR